MTSYDGYSKTFTIDKTTETYLVSGLTYRLRLRAVNDVGASDWTGTESIALAALPPQPSAPVRDSSTSDSRIVVSWTAPTTADSPGGDVIGYKLEMDDGLGGNFTVLYDGYNSPSLT